MEYKLLVRSQTLFPATLLEETEAGRLPGEVTQLGSHAESSLIEPRSPVPQLPSFWWPEVPWGLGRSKGHSWMPVYLGPETWGTRILW